MPVTNVYGRFEPTSLIAGDAKLMSRKVTLPSGLNSSGSPLQPGNLLGVKTVAATFTTAAAAKVGNTGNGTIAMGSPQTLANVQPGVYRIVMSSATAYQVYDPKGNEIGTGANGAAFGTQIKFTTTAGGTPMVSGDEFDVTVSQAAGALYTVASVAGGSNSGNGTLTLASPAFVDGVSAGVYTLQMTSPTAFQVYDPSGNPIGTGSTGVAFSNRIAFTLAAGGSAFVGGDTFAITVSAVALYIPCVATATDGSQVPVAVLSEEADTSAGSVVADAYFAGEFAFELMTVDASWTFDTLNNSFIAQAREIYIRRVGATA